MSVSPMRSIGIAHETRSRLRIQLSADVRLAAMHAAAARIAGVVSVRANHTLHCLIVHHDGSAATRTRVLDSIERLSRTTAALTGSRDRTDPAGAIDASMARRAQPIEWAPVLLALMVPAVPREVRSTAALLVVVSKLLVQLRRPDVNRIAALLDASSAVALALSGQPNLVAAGTVLRQVAESLSERLSRQADELLTQILPMEAEDYEATAGTEAGVVWSRTRPSDLQPGHRLRLRAGDVVPTDVRVIEGQAEMLIPAHQSMRRRVSAGMLVFAGDCLSDGNFEAQVVAPLSRSRLARLRAQVRHAIESRDPPGQLTTTLDRLLSLPLTASALVYGLTGDTPRAAAMLQADPRQGMDLALPLAREAALYALARNGLLAAGLEVIERLAVSSTLVLQHWGVVTTGIWAISSIECEAHADRVHVRQWLAQLADTPLQVLEDACYPDAVVRNWLHHGVTRREDAVTQHEGGGEIHLVGERRLLQIWGVGSNGRQDTDRTQGGTALRFAVLANGRLHAWITLSTALRPTWTRDLARLRALGFERIALCLEDTSDSVDADLAASLAGAAITPLGQHNEQLSNWVAQVSADGTPMVFAHATLREWVPAGSLSLSAADSDKGSHGILLGDPLESLAASRELARRIHRRLTLQVNAATVFNAALLTGTALRAVPPLATSLLHHGFALLTMLDSVRIEAMTPSDRSVPDDADPEFETDSPTYTR